MRNKLLFYLKFLVLIFFMFFFGWILIFNSIFYLLRLGDYSFEEAKE